MPGALAGAGGLIGFYGAADRHVRDADVAGQSRRGVHLRPGRLVLRRAALRRLRTVTTGRQLPFRRRLLVGAQRERLGAAVPDRRPGLPGRPAARDARPAAAVARQGAAARRARRLHAAAAAARPGRRRGHAAVRGRHGPAAGFPAAAPAGERRDEHAPAAGAVATATGWCWPPGSRTT